MKLKNLLKLGRYVKATSNYCTYGWENLLWLDIVLGLHNNRSLREKVAYLHYLEGKMGLANFYKSIGITFKKGNGIPDISTFSRCKKAFIRQSIDYGSLVRQVAQRIKEKVYHCAIDAKDTRHTGQCLKGRDNYKSIHYDKNRAASIIIFGKVDIKQYEKDLCLYQKELRRRHNELNDDLANSHHMTKWPFTEIHQITFDKACADSDNVEQLIERYEELIKFAIEIYLCDKEINCG